MAGWQSGHAAACKAVHAGSIPASASNKNMNQKITIFGLGYVGTSLAVLLAQNNDVVCIDINLDKVNQINSGISPIDDDDINEYLSSTDLSLKATLNQNLCFDSDLIIIATPTDYDERSGFFDTSSVEKIIYHIKTRNKTIPIFIKSTIPIGFTDKQNKLYESDNIIFSPEFLREGFALHDNLHPSRIIVSNDTDCCKNFVDLLLEGALKKDIRVIFSAPKEAESIKLFANTYLAMRVSFFNELDNFCIHNNLNSKDIISGIAYDDRIGNFYNNPSFGYGGYCLPKDTKQLLSNFDKVPQDIIQAIVKSNETRKDFIVNTILKSKPKVIGIYRLIMKSNSNNFRSSAIHGIIERFSKKDKEVVIFEPNLDKKTYKNCNVIKELDEFKKYSDIIVANRNDETLADVSHKVFTRDIFGDN